MKKIIMLVVFAIFTISGFAKEIEVSLPDTTSVTFTQVYNDVKEGITDLAIALKIPAEHVYGVLVKQQIINSITHSLLPLGALILICLFIILYRRGTKKEWEDNRDKAWSIITEIFLLIFIIASMAALSDVVQGFANPEYGAIKEIITFVK